MVAFTLYAILVGFLAARWRRRWRGLLMVIAAEAVLIGLAWLHYQIPYLGARGYPLFADIDIQPFQLFFYPYIVFILAMGLFIVALPQRAPVDSCWFCRYDLTSLLDEPGPVICPECGREHIRPGSRQYRRSGEDRSNIRRGDLPGREDTPQPGGSARG